MTSPENNEITRIVDFAIEIDEVLNSNDADGVDSQDEQSLVESASAELKRDDFTELLRVQNVLDFIGTVRKDIVRKSNEDTSVNLNDATIPQPATIDADSVAQHRELSRGGFPSVIGRYEIDQLLGEGGFASVFSARDPELNRTVALKVLKPTLFHGDASQRFEREAKAVALLSHPNIVPVFETGVAGSSRYIASAYCRAITLENWFKSLNGPTTPKTAATIVATLAEAIDHAHQRGIIHRDLKPSNVLIETAEDNVNVNVYEVPENDAELAAGLKVTDFGLARYEDSSDNLKTTEGAIVGTPAYMSPEQADGSSNITGATDIYSLGVMLYQLLTDKLPILGKTHIETILSITTVEPHPVRRLKKDVPADLDAICMKCLAKTPAGRYASAYELSADLNRWLNGKPVKARRISRLEQLGKWVRRNPALSTAIAGMAVGLIVATVQWRNATIHSASAKREAGRAARSIDLSQESIQTMVAEISTNSQIPAQFRKRLVEQAIALQERLLDEDPDNEKIIANTARTYFSFARTLHDLREFEESNENVVHAITLLDSITDKDAVTGMEQVAYNLQSLNYAMLGEKEMALEILKQSDVDGDNPDARAMQLSNQGRALSSAGQRDAAIAAHLRALWLYEDVGNNSVFTKGAIAGELASLGTILLDQEKYKEAEDTLLRARELYTEIATVTSFHESIYEQLARVCNELAVTQKETENYVSALDNAEKAKYLFTELRTHSALIVRYTGQFLVSQTTIIDVHWKTGNLDAMTVELDSLKSNVGEYPESEREYPQVSDDIAFYELSLGILDAKNGDLQLAREHLEEAETWIEKVIALAPLRDISEVFDLKTRLAALIEPE